MGRERLEPHSHAWYDRLARMQQGYYYPWKSRIAPFNGEDAYLELVRGHLSPASDVLDVGCGHGEVTLAIAPNCRTVTAYDRVPSYIQLAQEAASRTQTRNVTFICADSKAGGVARIPAEAQSFDLLISRRGPLHWIEDARRVARPGAVLIQLNPVEARPPRWMMDLPAALRALRAFEQDASGSMRAAVERRLELGGLALHSCWTFDVPELLPDVDQFYIWLTWGHAPDDVPPLKELKPDLERLFARHAGPDGLAVRHARFLWKAVVD